MFNQDVVIGQKTLLIILPQDDDMKQHDIQKYKRNNIYRHNPTNSMTFIPESNLHSYPIDIMFLCGLYILTQYPGNNSIPIFVYVELDIN